jgi:hypothetical protein
VDDYLVANVSLVVLDVPQALMGPREDAHKDQDVRRALMTPLSLAAEAHDLAVLVLHHLNRSLSKAVLDRVAASLGLSRAARAVLAIGPHPEVPDERVLVLAKSNLGPWRLRRSASGSKDVRSPPRAGLPSQVRSYG